MAESLRKQAIRQLRIPTLDKEISSAGKRLSYHDFLVFIKGAVGTFSISNEEYSKMVQYVGTHPDQITNV